MSTDPRSHIPVSLPEDAGPNQLLDFILRQIHVDMLNLERRFDKVEEKLDQRGRDDDESHRRIYDRLNSIESTQASQAAFLEAIKTIKESYDSMDQRMRQVEKFAAASGSRWKIIGAGLTIVATAVAGIIAAMIIRSAE